ncbi:unnamed protein product [Tilletia controversa]|uniref:Uncharacterized protein n=3 Tax=Tilletia TaxID=13289 RepID=A0A8X7MMV1_9BASI|nr:hypothetical protein CF328_g3118 [Tilletia controversa]KAE8204229.1 hypothetical protein CF335_g2729 [Tilletia laevis]KAE8252013.1 hypothetical protein A4X03_0g6271 [Tilletia caries]KAE8241855.1 hypothetical protein A4X06_0g7378 [Tilletia controversa]CAD6890179.1 unnamed protein product [Tilletia caries]
MAARNSALNALMPAPAGHADVHKIRKLTQGDGMEAFRTALMFFNVLSDYTLAAGPFLKTGLGIIQEIIGIVEQVKENTASCAEFVQTALDIFMSFLTAAQLSGWPILPGTSSAILFERVLWTIKTLKNHVEANAQLSPWRRLLKRGEFKGLVKSCTEDLDRSLLVHIVLRDLAPEIRADRGSVRSSADANQNTASSPIISTVKEQGDVPNPSPARISDLLNPSVQHGLQLVSTALKSEIMRRSTLEDTQTAEGDADAQGSWMVQPNGRSQHTFTSKEQPQMLKLREAMQRIFLPSDSEDLDGIFHNSAEDSETPAQAQRQPRELGLLDEDVMVLQILTALCRRKVIANGNALDWVNLASALRHLSEAFLMVNRSDEALATSEEAISIIEPMADLEPNRHNAHLAEAFNLAAKCH